MSSPAAPQLQKVEGPGRHRGDEPQQRQQQRALRAQQPLARLEQHLQTDTEVSMDKTFNLYMVCISKQVRKSLHERSFGLRHQWESHEKNTATDAKSIMLTRGATNHRTRGVRRPMVASSDSASSLATLYCSGFDCSCSRALLLGRGSTGVVSICMCHAALNEALAECRKHRRLVDARAQGYLLCQRRIDIPQRVDEAFESASY